MELELAFVSSPNRCGYLPDRDWSLAYEIVRRLSPAEYGHRLAQGWRRFGHALFRPQCQGCQECRPIRIRVDDFGPDRSQRRTWKANENEITLRVGRPAVSRDKLELYDRFHAYQAQAKGWPEHSVKDAGEYWESFVANPIPTQEWCYYLGSRLVGVGYVDRVPAAMSAIYFFYDPAERRRSLGTWNVLSILAEARRQGLAHVYLGYYVADCPSMRYKARFRPNEVLGPDGGWAEFLS
jgi:arginine-tRNA-protein transferase